MTIRLTAKEIEALDKFSVCPACYEPSVITTSEAPEMYVCACGWAEYCDAVDNM
jgi:hypothetical protein